MAYKVAQLRKQSSGSNNYMQRIEVTPSSFLSPNKFNDTGSFTDFALQGQFLAGETYYLRFIMHRIPEGFYSRVYPNQYAMFQTSDNMTYTLLLKKDATEDEETNPPQIIDTFTVSSLSLSEKSIGANTIYYSYTTVFTPSKTFGLLGFRLSRTAYDVLSAEGQRKWLTEEAAITGEKVEKTVYNDDGSTYTVSTQGKRLIYQGENGDICVLKNILEKSKNKTNWLKLGFQSRPGTLVVINNEPVRVGRSGTYEINNGSLINSFMITAPGGSDNNKIDAFLLDYAYNE